jgi:hypothetical protein
LNKTVVVYDFSSVIVSDVFYDLLSEIWNAIFAVVNDLLKWIGNVFVHDDLLNGIGSWIDPVCLSFFFDISYKLFENDLKQTNR